MLRLMRWYLERRGYVVLKAQEFEAAMTDLRRVQATITKSGALATLSLKRPKVVRRVDRALGRAEAWLEAAVA